MARLRPETIVVQSGSGIAGRTMHLQSPAGEHICWLIDEADVEQWAARQGYSVDWDVRPALEARLQRR